MSGEKTATLTEMAHTVNAAAVLIEDLKRNGFVSPTEYEMLVDANRYAIDFVAQELRNSGRQSRGIRNAFRVRASSRHAG